MADLSDRTALVKICGLTDEAGIDACLSAGADLIGLVFVPGSPRTVALDRARRLADRVRGQAPLVGLFVDPALSDVEEVLESVPLDLLQLHGRETATAVGRFRGQFGLPVIKAQGVAAAADCTAAEESGADLLLYDAKPPEGAVVTGGHGRAFDWSVLANHPHASRWLLAGGLTPDNIAEAITACRTVPGFLGVDVSSGVEAERGRKDPALIHDFVAAARAAMAAPHSPPEEA